MAKTIREAIQELTGKPASDEQIQKIMACGNALGIKNDDPMIMLFMILEHYNGLYTEAPKRIQSAMENAERAASGVARASVEAATAKMIPGVQKAVEDAAKKSIVAVQLGSSMITIWIGLISLSITFGLGWLMGGRVFSAFADKTITQADFWHETGWVIASGFIAAPLSALAWYLLETENAWIGWVAAGLATILTAADILNVLNILPVH